MILAKPFAIAAGVLPSGGSNYQITGSKFFLLAASEPLFVKLFRGAELVGDFTGFNGGFEAGPFCEPFTAFALATASGNAGNALIGVGDEDMSYNPLAGSLSFSNPSNNAAASPAPPAVSTETQATLNQQNFGATVTVAAVAADVAVFELSSGGFSNAKTATVRKLTVHNPGAAAINVMLGVMNSYLALASAGAVGGNLYTGGAARVFTLYGQAEPAVSLPSTTALPILKTANVPAGQDVVIDMSAAPMVLPKGTAASFVVYADTANTAVTFSLDWSES